MKEQAHSCPARAPYRSDFFGFGIQSRDPWAPRSRNLETKQCLHFTTVGRVQDGTTAFSGEKLPIFKTTCEGRMVFVTNSAASPG